MPSPPVLKQLSITRFERFSWLTESSPCSCGHHEMQSSSAAPFLPWPARRGTCGSLFCDLTSPSEAEASGNYYFSQTCRWEHMGLPHFFVSSMPSCLRSSSSHLALFYRSNRTLSQPLFARINKSSPSVSIFKIGFLSILLNIQK